MFKTTTLITALAGLAFTGTAAASIITPVDSFGSNEKDNYGGNLGDLTNGSGMNDNPDTGGTMPSDINSWVASSSHYKAEWQTQDLLGDGEAGEDLPTNGKIAWAIIDLGSAQSLGELHLWHIRENNGRWASDFNVYVAASPTVAPSSGPTNNTSSDYDFASGGWTTIATGETGSFKGKSVIALNGSVAQYVGLEIIANNGDTQRTGFAELAVTQGTPIPEPGSLALLGLGSLLVARRRRG